jgi:hypothetical protein
MIKQTRWYWSESPPSWLAEGEFPADTLLDFRTRENTLSVWLVEDNAVHIERLQTALMAARDKVDAFDYLLFDLDVLSDCDIDVEQSRGDTPDYEANSCHRDLIHLSGLTLVELIKRICASDCRRGRIPPKKAKQMIADAVESGQIPLQELKERLRGDVIAYLNQGG